MRARFKDRVDAGNALADRLEDYKGSLILAIPRGGVIVADAIANRLRARLDVICPRKLGALNNPELAIGAIMHDGTYLLNDYIIKMLSIPEQYIKEEMARKRKEALERLIHYRGDDRYDLKDKSIILVDDGVATGATVLVASKWLKMQEVKDLIIAIPVGPPDTLARIERYGRVIAILKPYNFGAVGEFYDNFDPVEDDEVVKILSKYK